MSRLFDDMSDGLRARILAKAHAAHLSPIAWLRTKGLDPAAFGFGDPEPETKTSTITATTPPKDSTQSLRDRERVEQAAEFVADVERLERRLAAARRSR